jgi:hypothetical protein
MLVAFRLVLISSCCSFFYQSYCQLWSEKLLFGRNESYFLDCLVGTNIASARCISFIRRLFHTSVGILQSMAGYSWCVNYWRYMVIGMLIKTLWKFWLMDQLKHWDPALFAWQLCADTVVYFKLKMIDSCTSSAPHFSLFECILILVIALKYGFWIEPLISCSCRFGIYWFYHYALLCGYRDVWEIFLVTPCRTVAEVCLEQNQ